MTISDQQYARFGRFVAATLGANLEWDSGADYLETIATGAEAILKKSIGGDDDATLAFWREVADRAGAYYDEEPCTCADWESEEPGHAHRGDGTGCAVESCYCEHFDRKPYLPGGEFYKED